MMTRPGRERECELSSAVRRPIEPFWGRGRIESVNLGRRRHKPKEPVFELTLTRGHGVEGDVHAGEFRLHAVKEPTWPNTREVSLIDAHVLDEFARMGFDVGPGALGENITVRGIPLDAMAPGDRLHCGSLVLEVTENRIPCTVLPTVDNRLLKEMLGRSGLLAYVVRSGTIQAGMEVFAERAEMPASSREELVARVLEAAEEAFGRHLRGAVLKGSALKGGFIPGYSDFDVHLLIDEAAMESPRTPKLEYAVRLQRGLGTIDRGPYRVHDIQVYAVSYETYPEDWVPPLPDTFACVYGAYPEAWDRPDLSHLRMRADVFLSQLAKVRAGHIRSYLDKHDAGLARVVRLLGASVKPALYCGAVSRGYHPVDVWTVRPLELVQWSRRKGLAMEALWRFLTAIGEWELISDDPEALRALWLDGMNGLQDIEAWVHG